MPTPTGDPLPADTLEGGFDRAAMRDQQLQDAIDRALVLPVTAAVSGNIVPLPEADKLLGWNSAADALENKILPDGQAVYSTVANTRLGAATAEAVTPDGLASLWQRGANLASAASIAKPSDANLGGYYQQTGNTTTDSYWAGSVDGEEMEIIYSGTPTLSAAGNLRPPAAVAYAVASGDVIRWRWDATATKWRAVGGMHATGAALAVAVVPSFAANKSSDQTSIASATATKITFPNEDWDVGGYYDAANSKYLPLIAGKYLITAAAFFLASNIVDQAQYQLAIYKNGSAWRWGNDLNASGTTGLSPTVTALVDLNGTTDYVEIFAFGAGAGNKQVKGDATLTWFQGVRVG